VPYLTFTKLRQLKPDCTVRIDCDGTDVSFVVNWMDPDLGACQIIRVFTSDSLAGLDASVVDSVVDEHLTEAISECT
jgi:hypothetical protein